MPMEAQTPPVVLGHSQTLEHQKEVKLSNVAAAKGSTIITIFLFILANGQVDMVWFTEE